MATSSYSLDNEVFASLLIYSALLIFKTVLLIPLTSYYRIIKGSLPSLEDAKFFAPNNPDKQKQLLRPDESVQRVSTFWSYVVVIAQLFQRPYIDTQRELPD